MLVHGTSILPLQYCVATRSQMPTTIVASSSARLFRQAQFGSKDIRNFLFRGDTRCGYKKGVGVGSCWYLQDAVVVVTCLIGCCSSCVTARS